MLQLAPPSVTAFATATLPSPSTTDSLVFLKAMLLSSRRTNSLLAPRPPAYKQLRRWLRVDQWTTRGGSELGTNRTLPDTDLEGVAAKLAEYKIDGLFIIGGFEGMVSLNLLEKGRTSYKALRIPLVHLPATISNNVPITEWSIGSDTSINVLVEACDAIKQSASASRNRVFVVETQGAGCGYIAVLGALAVCLLRISVIHFG